MYICIHGAYSLTITIFCGSFLNQRTGRDEICRWPPLEFWNAINTRNLTTTGSFMTKIVGLFNLSLELWKNFSNRESGHVTFFFLDVFPTTLAQHLLGPEGRGMLCLPICHTGKCETYLSSGFLLGSWDHGICWFFHHRSRDASTIPLDLEFQLSKLQKMLVSTSRPFAGDQLPSTKHATGIPYVFQRYTWNELPQIPCGWNPSTEKRP